MRALTIALLAAVTGFPSLAQKFGAAENLAPYIPTPQAIVERMLEAGHVTPDDVVYDLGSGDGRVVITAAQKFGAHAVGVEILPDLCRQTRARIKSLGLDDRVQMMEDSVFHVDLSHATVVTMYFLTSSNERLKPNLEKYLRPGARVVSNQFPVRGWKPVEVVHVMRGAMDHSIFVYRMGRTK
jgi:ubiquinone/menaquinone biosynthesis C-methylase UbiE